jgi:AcrR family transcriptional regulator
MPDVKPRKRRYRSEKRAAQAADTREAILSAARALFLSEGWIKTTIAGIASAAGVSDETVYSSFGSKKALLHELISRTVRGARPDMPLTEQEAPRRIAHETDQSRQIELFSDDIAKVLSRVAPLMDVVRAAAGTDAAIAELYAGLHRGRRKNLEWFANALIHNGPLRGGMDAKAAGSILWRLASPDLFLLMRRVEGGSQRAYADWLANSLKRLLLDG